jgi:hypothetical protein
MVKSILFNKLTLICDPSETPRASLLYLEMKRVKPLTALRKMFSLKRRKNATYLYVKPVKDGLARWEVINQKELDNRVEENLLENGSRLFKVDHEITIRFEKTTHLE